MIKSSSVAEMRVSVASTRSSTPPRRLSMFSNLVETAFSISKIWASFTSNKAPTWFAISLLSEVCSLVSRVGVIVRLASPSLAAIVTSRRSTLLGNLGSTEMFGVGRAFPLVIGLVNSAFDVAK